MSSTAVLGEDELAQLTALMPVATSHGEATQPHGSNQMWRVLQLGRRESFIAITLVVGLLVYYWGRDRLLEDTVL
jgi:hypothetical protein